MLYILYCCTLAVVGGELCKALLYQRGTYDNASNILPHGDYDARGTGQV